MCFRCDLALKKTGGEHWDTGDRLIPFLDWFGGAMDKMKLREWTKDVYMERYLLASETLQQSTHKRT